MIKELRERTQAGMLDCKKALTENNGDMEAAADFLRKKGLAAANKKAGREAKEGIVITKISDDKKTATIMEMNCETDFVAKNETFQATAKDILDDVYAKALTAGTEIPADIDEKVKAAISTNGENMGIGSFDSIKVEGNGLIASYIHSNNKIGVLVKLTSDGSADALEELGKEIAMQAAAAAPQFLAPADVPEDAKEREKDIYREQMKNSGKPENIIDKIVEGKLGKFYSEVCLLNQVYIKDSGKNITDLIKEYSTKAGADITVDCFVRLQVGA